MMPDEPNAFADLIPKKQTPVASGNAFADLIPKRAAPDTGRFSSFGSIFPEGSRPVAQSKPKPVADPLGLRKPVAGQFDPGHPDLPKKKPKPFLDQIGLNGPKSIGLPEPDPQSMIALPKHDTEAEIAKLPFTKADLTTMLSTGSTTVRTHGGGQLPFAKAIAMWRNTGATLPKTGSALPTGPNVLDDPQTYYTGYGSGPTAEDKARFFGNMPDAERTAKLNQPVFANLPSRALTGYLKDVGADDQTIEEATADLGITDGVWNLARYAIPGIGGASLTEDEGTKIQAGDYTGAAADLAFMALLHVGFTHGLPAIGKAITGFKNAGPKAFAKAIDNLGAMNTIEKAKLKGWINSPGGQAWLLSWEGGTKEGASVGKGAAEPDLAAEPEPKPATPKKRRKVPKKLGKDDEPTKTYTVYRGHNLSLDPKTQNLTGLRSIGDFIPGAKEKGPDMLGIEWYTETPFHAQSYANSEQALLDQIKKGGSKDPAGSFRILTGREPPTQPGKVQRLQVAPKKVLDLSDLGPTPDYSAVMKRLLEAEGSEPPKTRYNSSVDQPEWKRWNELSRDVGVDESYNADADSLPPYRLLRNDPPGTHGAGGVDNHGTAFVKWAKAHGYDAVRMKEGDGTHIALLDPDVTTKTEAPQLRQSPGQPSPAEPKAAQAGAQGPETASAPLTGKALLDDVNARRAARIAAKPGHLPGEELLGSGQLIPQKALDKLSLTHDEAIDYARAYYDIAKGKFEDFASAIKSEFKDLTDTHIKALWGHVEGERNATVQTSEVKGADAQAVRPGGGRETSQGRGAGEGQGREGPKPAGEGEGSRPKEGSAEGQPKEGPQATGLANQVQAKEVKAGVFEQPKKGTLRTKEESQAYGEDVLTTMERNSEDSRAFAESVAQKIADEERPYSWKEHGVLLAGKRRLMGDMAQADFELTASLGTKGENAARLRAQGVQARLQAYLDNVMKGGSEWHNTGESMQAGVNLDTGKYEDVIVAAEKVGPVSEKQRAEYEKLVNDFGDIKSELDKAHATIAQQEAEKALRKAESRARRGQSVDVIRARRAASAANIKKILVESGHQLNSLENLGLTGAKLAAEVGRYVKTLVDEGITRLPDVMDKLREVLPGFTDEEIHRLHSGYGIETETRTLSEKQRILHELKTQSDLIAKLVDAMGGDYEPGSGPRTLPSETVRKMRKTLEEITNAQGKRAAPATDPVVRLRIRIQDALDDLEFGPAAKKPKIPDTPRIIAMERHLTAIKKATGEKWGLNLPKTEQERISALQKRINEARDQLKGQYRKVKGKRPATTDEIKKTAAELNKALHDLKVTDDIHDLEEQIRTGEYKEPPPPKTRQVSALERRRDQLDAEIRMKIASQQPLSPGRTMAEFTRGNVLSSPLSFLNIGSSLASQHLIEPLAEATGPIIKHTVGRLGGLGEMAGTELRWNLKGEQDAITQWAHKPQWEDFRDTIIGKGSEHKNEAIALGIEKPRAEARNRLTRYAQHTHEAMKTFSERSAFARQWQKELQDAHERGLSTANDEWKRDAITRSWLKAKEAKLQNDGIVGDIVSHHLSQPVTLRGDELTATGYRKGAVGDLVRGGARAIVPIAHVPVNLAMRTMETSPIGLAYGATRHAAIMAKGGIMSRQLISDAFKAGGMRDGFRAIMDASKSQMTPQAAKAISQAYKRGLLGTGVFVVGAQSTALDVDDRGRLIVGNYALPSFMSHIPAVEALVMGVHYRKSKGGIKGLGSAMVAGAADALSHTPLIDVPREIQAAVGSYWESPDTREKKLDKGAGTILRSIFIPQLIQKYAAARDKNDDGQVIYRRREGFIDELAYGIPWWRESRLKDDPARTQTKLTIELAKHLQPYGIKVPSTKQKLDPNEAEYETQGRDIQAGESDKTYRQRIVARNLAALKVVTDLEASGFKGVLNDQKGRFVADTGGVPVLGHNNRATMIRDGIRSAETKINNEVFGIKGFGKSVALEGGIADRLRMSRIVNAQAEEIKARTDMSDAAKRQAVQRLYQDFAGEMKKAG